MTSLDAYYQDRKNHKLNTSLLDVPLENAQNKTGKTFFAAVARSKKIFLLLEYNIFYLVFYQPAILDEFLSYKNKGDEILYS